MLRIIKRATQLAVLAIAGLLPAQAHRVAAATPPNAWYACVLHLDYPTMTHVVRRECVTYPITKAHRGIIGWTLTRHRVSPHVIHSTRYPRFAPPPAPAVDVSPQVRPYVTPWLGAIARASAISGVPTRVIAAILMVESSGRQVCYSSDGLSVGLMQVIPATGQSMWQMRGIYYSWQYVHDRICADPYFDVLTGSLYLAYQWARYRNWYTVAGAYNAGSWTGVPVNVTYANKFLRWYVG